MWGGGGWQHSQVLGRRGEATFWSVGPPWTLPDPASLVNLGSLGSGGMNMSHNAELCQAAVPPFYLD